MESRRFPLFALQFPLGFTGLLGFAVAEKDELHNEPFRQTHRQADLVLLISDKIQL